MRKMIDIESRYKKKIVRNYICDVMDFFDRIIYLLELSIHNILAILSIPMFIVGMSGGVYAYKMIMDICKMGRSENRSSREEFNYWNVRNYKCFQQLYKLN